MFIHATKSLIVEFLSDESGQGTTEFRNALVLAALCAVLLIGASYAVHNGRLAVMPDSVRTQLRSVASAGHIY